jgi:hypothetical protein
MNTVMLSDQELQYVLELLQREIPNLRNEIWHTDTHDYREFLKERERLLKTLVEKFSTYSSQMATA